MPGKREVPELPVEEKYRITARALERTVWYLIDGLIREGVDPKIVLKVSNQIHAGGGEGMGRRFKKMLNLGDDVGAAAVGNVVMNRVMGFDIELVEAGEDFARTRVHKCPDWDVIRDLGVDKKLTPDELCQPCNIVNEAFCRSINAGVKQTRAKCMSKGDEVCEATYQLVKYNRGGGQ